MKFKEKEFNKEDLFDMDNRVINKMDLMRDTSKVHSVIKSDVSDDFVLAKLDEKEKEFVIEMFCNAKHCKKLLYVYAKNRKVWKRDSNGNYVRDYLNDDSVKFIHESGNNIFDDFMNRIYMLVVLNRNVNRNVLLRLLAGLEEEVTEEKERGELGQDVLNLIKQNERKEELRN